MIIAVGKQTVRIERGGLCCFKGEEWTNYPHRHPEFQEMCWVIAGSGVFQHGQESFPLALGSCFVSEPNVAHEISSPQTEDLQLHFVSFWVNDEPSIADAITQAAWNNYQKSHRIHAHVPQVSAYWNLISSAPHQQRESLLLRSLFLESLTALSVSNSSTETVAPQEPSAFHDIAAERAMSIIRERCCAAPSIADIAAEVDLSERQLRRRFQRRYDCGLVEAINNARLERARRLLVMQRSVSAVAEAVGIASPAMFCRLFKQAYGCTPSEWRQQQVPSGKLPRTVFGHD